MYLAAMSMQFVTVQFSNMAQQIRLMNATPAVWTMKSAIGGPTTVRSKTVCSLPIVTTTLLTAKIAQQVKDFAATDTSFRLEMFSSLRAEATTSTGPFRALRPTTWPTAPWPATGQPICPFPAHSSACPRLGPKVLRVHVRYQSVDRSSQTNVDIFSFANSKLTFPLLRTRCPCGLWRILQWQLFGRLSHLRPWDRLLVSFRHDERGSICTWRRSVEQKWFLDYWRYQKEKTFQIYLLVIRTGVYYF